MSIWINNKLAPYSYKKSLLGLSRLVCWIEGTENVKFNTDSGINHFGIAGGPIWTNYGIKFTREELQDLVNQMNPKSELCIAYPDQYVSTNYNRYRDEKTIEEVFAEDNDMVQVGSSTFAPSSNLEKLLEERKVEPDYILEAEKILNAKRNG